MAVSILSLAARRKSLLYGGPVLLGRDLGNHVLLLKHMPWGLLLPPPKPHSKKWLLSDHGQYWSR